MRVLAIGDIVGEKAVETVKENLKEIKETKQIDFVIANGENAKNGNGLDKNLFNQLITAGVDVITMGNHTWGDEEIYQFIEDDRIIRPGNITKGIPGKGYTIKEKNGHKIMVMNLIGRRNMEGVYFSDNPFIEANEILERYQEEIKIIFVDFHAQCTGEKFMLAYYLDGRVSAVYGTHTHVQTANETIMPKGTGFITDIGMTGPIYSDLGCDAENSLKRYIEDKPVQDIVSNHAIMLNGAIFEIDENTGKTINVERINIVY